ncbi:helix-turn-helix domain-containing protein [Kitasatospora sp. CM 4170]|uniref:Helix-turn-helix domain-containing protein n=1 Tax=Kitasatospora aburaviensis TaxID=67265 RepID=A0ABW1ET74_9ACTN|nr:helix-turn-helix domain-containing protein [Kitasatospora sp. CM 4170]WNM45967.1 helix-turn-helix domain-containing protein [Kitasatospora sp. CM 4170]
MESSAGHHDSDATRLYARLLAEPGRPPTALGPGWDERRLAAATAELLGLGLLQPTAATPPAAAPGGSAAAVGAGGHAVVSVDTAVRQLLLDTDAQVTALVEALRRARDSVDRLHTGYLPVQHRHHAGTALELVRGADRIAALLEDAARGARTEALSLRPGQDLSGPALAGKLARERLALAHGAALRTIYPAAVLRRPAVLAHVRELTAAGARIRAAHSLPLWLIVVDARLAILPAPGSGSSGSGSGAGQDEGEGSTAAQAAVVVREPALVALVAELFEYFWSAAWTPPELLPGASEMTDRHHEVLRMLAAGLTDAAIARKLEVSERTVRRLVADLTADLGAESRFQAGVYAARLGRI